jgi:Hsp70 protein
MSGYVVAVDYGTVNTVAVLRRPDGHVRPLLFDGSLLMPSAACVGPDGELVVGRDAQSAGRADPAAFVPDPRSRIDVGTVVLGRSTVPVVDVIGATLTRVVQEAIQAADGALPRLVLTHPGSWSEFRRARLAEAGLGTGLGLPTLVPTPVAAAWYQAESVGDLGPGPCVLVYHLGAGPFEVSLLRRTAEGHDLLAATECEDVRGTDFDELLINMIGAAVSPDAAQAWQRLVTPTSAAELRQFMQWRDDVRSAKEALSRQSTVGVQVPLVGQDVDIARGAFESAAEPLLARTVDLAAELLVATGTPMDQVGHVLLLGGSSRIPLVTSLLRRRFRFAPTACKEPELAVAEGALIAADWTAAAPPGSTRRAMAAGEPTLELTLPVPPPTATSAVAESGLPRRPMRLLAVAGGLACVVVLAGLFAIFQPPHGVPGGRRDAPPTATGQSIDVLASVPATALPSAQPTPGASPATTPASTATPTPSATTGTPPVAVALTATPASGTCSTNITFVAHFTVNDAGKYRWHWVFGGPNYSDSSGNHDQDKAGDVPTTKKFGTGGSGTYWAQVQITSPVTVTSNQASVQITCAA